MSGARRCLSPTRVPWTTLIPTFLLYLPSVGQEAGQPSSASPLRRIAGRVATISNDELQEFNTRGHMVTRGLLDRESTLRVASHLSALLANYSRNAFVQEGGQGKEVRLTFAVHKLDGAIKDFISGQESELWYGARRLTGTQDICVLMDRGFSKDPGDRETHWHRDDESVDLHNKFPGVRTVHAWIPLSAVGHEMGTLHYLVGTHLGSRGWLEGFLASILGWEFAWWALSEHSQDDALEVGDVAWHDGWVLHSAGANLANNGVRNGYAVSFAYCAKSEGDCGDVVRRISDEDVTCQANAALFGPGWREYRDGGKDYTKTELQEPLFIRCGRFVWRSMLGALGGVIVHQLVLWFSSRCCGNGGQTSKRKSPDESVATRPRSKKHE